MRKRLLIGLALFTALHLSHAKLGRDMVKEGKIEQELNGINPSLVEPFREARIAMDKGDSTASVRLLEGVCAAAPEFDPAQRRLGMGLAAQGKQNEGIQHVEKAVAIRRDAANLISLATVLAFPGDKLNTSTQAQKERAFSLLKEAVEMPDGRDAGAYSCLASLANSRR